MTIDVLLPRFVLAVAVAVIGVLILLAAPTARRRDAFGVLAAFAAIFVADDLLLALPLAIPALRPPDFEYNWGGKFLSLALGLACIYLFRVVTPEQAGFTLKQQPGSIRPAAILVGAVLLIELPLFWLLFGATRPSVEDHVFQLTMPGLDEELIYRGVLLALADRAARTPWRVVGANVGWGAVATAVLFGAVHAVSLSSDWSLGFNWMAGLLPFIGGLVFVWLRARTGSLLWPIILHNAANELANLVSWFRYLAQ